MRLLCAKRNMSGISKTKQFYEEGTLAWKYINNFNLPWLETLMYLLMEEEINQIAAKELRIQKMRETDQQNHQQELYNGIVTQRQWMGLLCVTNRESQQLPKRQFSATAEKQPTVTPLCVQTQCLSQCIYHARNENHQ